MADIYYKEGSSWKILASNPFAVGAYYESMENISPATIVGGNWLSVATDFSESFNFTEIYDGIEQNSAIYAFNSTRKLYVSGQLYITYNNIPFTTDSSGKFIICKTPYPPAKQQDRIGSFNTRNSPTTNMSTAFLSVDSNGNIYTTKSPNTTYYIANNKNTITIDYSVLPDLQYTLTTPYAWVRIS